MEIAPAPARRRLSSRARAILVLAVLAPVTLLALVPTMFGLERYVVSSESMAGSIDRGSVLFARVVPVSDLEVGDVITYRPPSSSGDRGLVTRRIVRVEGGLLQTQGDARSEPDPWVVPVEGAALPRVVVAIPYVGYPFVAPIGREGWLMLLVVPSVMLGLALLRDPPRRRSPSALRDAYRSHVLR